MKASSLRVFFAFGLLFSTSLIASGLEKVASGKVTFYKEAPQQYRSHDDAAKFCSSLGYRLPTILEYLALDDIAKDVMEKSLYWSQNSSKDGAKAYYFSTKDSDVNVLEKRSNLYLLCTEKSEKKQLNGRFKKTAVGVVDGETKLTWQLKNSENKRERFDFEEAKKVCTNLNVQGVLGWRLPTLTELYSLAESKNENEKEFMEVFADTEPRYYRSSELAGDFSNSSMVVGFKIGSIASLSKKERVFARCVRDSK